MLITPPGTSDVAATSAKVIATQGSCSAAITTHALPPVITGAISEINPNSGDPSGAMTPTTPVGSGVEYENYGLKTGLALPMTAASLSVQPA
jgi:hypothetical protein